MPAETWAESSRGPVGLLLAAGAGRRMGGPKALLRDQTGRALVTRAVGVLLEGGCQSVVVVVGAEAAEVGRVLAGETRVGDPEVGQPDPRVRLVVAADWDAGQGISLRAGLTALGASAEPSSAEAVAVVVLLVDLPGVGPAAVERVAAGAGPTTLARATYGGRPGHPVVLGRDHWAAVLAALDPERGARDYLALHPTRLIACDDVADGQDVDEPADARSRGLHRADGPPRPEATSDEPRRPRPDVKGPTVDDQTRCVHYHGPHDVIAIEFACCGEFYPCHRCHQETADHPAEQWPIRDRDAQAILCGVCGRTMSIDAYLGATGCPSCGAQFNDRCRLHHPLYFAI